MIDVLLFAKAPRPGFVKTRLARDIGDAAALSLYRLLGIRVVEAIRAVSRITVWFDPPDAHDIMEQWLGQLQFRPQQGIDLGGRLEHGFEAHFREATAPALAIGVDAPDLDAETIRLAGDALSRHDVVLGPTVDGGYYLIGMGQLYRDLFVDIPWGSHRVFAETITRCESSDLHVHSMPILRDVDDVRDARAAGLWPA